MADRTPYQRKIIERYYDNRDQIMLDKLSTLVTDLYLADTKKKRDRLWERVAAAMSNLKVKDAIAAHILKSRSPELLATHLKDWIQGQRQKK
jgi:hypothetical protein